LKRCLKFLGLVDHRGCFHFPTLVLAVAAARLFVPAPLTLYDGVWFFSAAMLYAFISTIEWQEREEASKRVQATAVPIGELEARVKELEKMVGSAKLAGALGRKS
jgi:hypothetical protein